MTTNLINLDLLPPAVRDGRAVVSCRVSGALGPFVFEMEVPEGPVSDRLDAFVAATIYPAQKLGANVIANGPVSARLVQSIPRIINIHRLWRRDNWKQRYPEFKSVVVMPESVADAPFQGTGVATFFSGGIDSFCTVIERYDEITDLIFIDDFEGRHSPELQVELRANAAAAAAALGKRLVSVRFNAKEFASPYVSWHHYHGSYLAAVALVLGPRYSRVIVPSTHDVNSMWPWGSHPILDPLFSVGGCEIVHDRVDLNRLEKTAIVASRAEIMPFLRVCWEPSFNCGHCGKCARTVLALQVLGMSDLATSFPRRILPLTDVRHIELPEPQTLLYIEEMVQHLETVKQQPELAEAMRAAIRRARRRFKWQWLPDLGARVTARLRRMTGRTRRVLR